MTSIVTREIQPVKPGLSDLERERSLIIASVHAHCGPRAECLGRRRLLGKAALL